jgi:hypothetical protein
VSPHSTRLRPPPAQGGATARLEALVPVSIGVVVAASGMPALVLDAVLLVALVAGVRRLRRRPDQALAVGRRLLAWRNMLLRHPPIQGDDALERQVGQLRSVRPGAPNWTAAAAYGVGSCVLFGACLATVVDTPELSVSVLPIAYTAVAVQAARTGRATSGACLLPAGHRVWSAVSGRSRLPMAAVPDHHRRRPADPRRER